ncbi:MAG: OmpA family protein [Alphaproteobacteria bacterium]|nr:OmpA family protein [Alphaproteobacteria bacterium]
MKLRTTLLAAAASLAIAPAASAEGLYGAIGAGLSYMGYENDISNDAPGGSGPFAFDSSSDYDKGIGIYAAVGYGWDNGFRTEFEFSFRESDLDQIDPTLGFSGFPSGSISGSTKTYGFMANVLYDFNGVSDVLTPYVGIGVGAANIDNTITGSVAAGGAPTPALSIAYGDSRTVLAGQAIAGAAIGLADGLTLDISYRYFRPIKQTFMGTLNGAPAGLKVGTTSHNIFAGLRWNFGTDSTPAVQYKDCWDGSSVPMTAECPPQLLEEQSADLDPVGFTVYFDYDKANLTPQASTLIAEAAGRALENDIDGVVVSGNTDTSGSSAYNQALSERRAKAVHDALIANGVPADRIRSEAYGESNPAKATPDGVREPLNRRSEVTISFE